jgi:transposase
MKKNHHQQRGNARTSIPERRQIEFRELSLDQWLEPSHRVRDIWAYVQSLDLSDLYQSIKATRTHVGRNPIDPQILFALWLFATLEGITSARRIAELTTRDIAYMWICGGVSVNYHSLSDFRTAHGDLLERILTDSIGVLMHHGLVNLETIAQDGMRVRASAGSGSFRRQESLESALEEAKEFMDQLQQSQATEGDGGNRRQQAARERSAREKQARLEAACLEMEDIQARYKKRTSSVKSSEPRASTTDPECRRMKMGDQGFRPAMNVELASDGDAQMVVCVDVTSQGSDSGLMKPMYDDVCQTYGVTPKQYLVDGGFSKKEDIEHLENEGTEVYAPLYREKQQIDQGKNPYAANPKEGAGMTAHRARMGTAEAKWIFRDRPKIAEFPNADCRNRGLTQFRVRGLAKAKAQTLWHVLVFNYLRMKSLVCPRRELSYLEIVMTS